MTKQNLFNLLAFFFAVALLQVLGVHAGFAYAVWILAIVTALGLIYNYCHDDPKQDSNYH
jgi:predicted membrane protein